MVLNGPKSVTYVIIFLKCDPQACFCDAVQLTKSTINCPSTLYRQYLCISCKEATLSKEFF